MFVGIVAPLQISLLSLLATSFYHKGGNHCKCSTREFSKAKQKYMYIKLIAAVLSMLVGQGSNFFFLLNGEGVDEFNLFIVIVTKGLFI